MKQDSHNLRVVLIWIIFVILFLAIAQDKLGFAELRPLSGDITYPKEDTLSLKNWFEGNYQKKKEECINDLFGLRNFCVRLNNQIAYSLFKVAKANEVIVGKNSYLYEEKYITSFMGKDLISEKEAREKVARLKFISDTLEKMNKQLLLVFAVGKASYYPEYIPAEYKKINEQTNYKMLSKWTKEAGIHVLDMNAWFIEQKNRSPYPLYSQYGIHGSKYGNYLLADSIVKSIEQLRKIDMPELYYDSLMMKQPEGLDYDIADGMNLLFRLKSFETADLKMKVREGTGKTKPSVLVISDSFYWWMYDAGINKCFSNDHFWFYNKQVYPESLHGGDLKVNTLSLKNEIKKHDVIILIATETNLAHLGWEFPEFAETVLKGGTLPHSDYYHKRVKELSNYIKQDPVWLNETVKKAKRNGVSLDVQIVREAEWIVEHEEGIN